MMSDQEIVDASDLSKAVTELVMGRCWHNWDMHIGDSHTPAHYTCTKCGVACYRPAQDAPNVNYATDADAALVLWKKIGATRVETTNNGRFMVKCTNSTGYDAIYAVAPTLPEAMCVAALRSVGHDCKYEETGK